MVVLMKKTISLLLVALFLFFGCTAPQPQEKTLTIYTYDSMVSEYGLGPKVVPKFEEECGCKVNMVALGDAGQVLNRAIIEKNNPKADVIIGVDNSLASKAIEAGIFEPFVPSNFGIVPQDLRFDATNSLIPFDYGFIAFVYDSEKVGFEPKSFEDLLRPELEKKIVVENPRTSSPGLALLLWTVAVYGDPGYKDYWEKVKPNILTVTPGWDEAAGMFRAGEAPIYLSYATSPPYYVEFEGITTFRVATFEEGHYLQVEGMGLVKGAKNRELAKQFIEFALTESFQEEIPLNQFMFPVNQEAELPPAFDYAARPSKKVLLDDALAEEKQEGWIAEWEKIMSS